MKCIVRKTVIFIIGLTIMALSASLSTKASLGVSPISSVPYTLSLIPGSLSFGACTFVFNIVLFVAGILVMRHNYKPMYALCAVFVIVFSYLCDVFLIVFEGVSPDNYLEQWIVELISAVALALGIALTMVSSISMLPGDFFVRFVARIKDWNFGLTKICFDFSCIIASVVISLAFLPEISGIREGTIMFIIAVGPMVNFFFRLMDRAGLLMWVDYEPIAIDVHAKE